MANEIIGSIRFDEEPLFSEASSTIHGDVTYGNNTLNTRSKITDLLKNPFKKKKEVKNGTIKNKNEVMDRNTIDYLNCIENHEFKKKVIIDYLKVNCMTPKEGEQSEHVMEDGEKGVRYSFTLPSVLNGFKCKKIKWFISDREVKYGELREKKRYPDSFRRPTDITHILLYMREFFEKLGVYMDKEMDLTSDLCNWKNCETYNIFREITGLNDAYWLMHSRWDCGAENCDFGTEYDDESEAHLFLNLSISEGK